MTNTEIKAMLKEAKELTERGTDELIIDEYKVTWKPVTSTRLDTSAIKKALPDVAERFTKTSTSKRFCLA